jgi:hypothetical protein
MDYFSVATVQKAEGYCSVYTKDFASLLELLSISGQSGVLTIEQPEYEGIPWQAQVTLVEGKVTSCLLRSKVDGRVLLRDAEVTRWLSAQGKLYWRLEEVAQKQTEQFPQAAVGPSADAVVPAQPASRFIPVPCRTPRGMQVAMGRSWSRDHRLVFALVDGRRTIAEIAALLHKLPEQVVQVLNDLRAGGLIT